jgi:uncharacterized protein (TIGR02217 family)
MAIIATRLSSAVEMGFSSAPRRRTLVEEFNNGNESRIGMWDYPKHYYSARYATFDEEQHDELLNAVHATRGRLYSLLFKDWSDYKAVSQQLSPSVGTQDPVQLVKGYTFGSETSNRVIRKPVEALTTIYEDTGSGPDMKVGVLDDATGLFTPSSNWQAGTHTWTGEFLVPVRFDSDEITFVSTTTAIWETDVGLIEVFNE